MGRKGKWRWEIENGDWGKRGDRIRSRKEGGKDMCREIEDGEDEEG